MDDSAVPVDVLEQVRAVCLGLPEAYEEPAWVGTRWRVRKHTFAHVFVLDADSPPVLARAGPPTAAPTTVVTFRSSGAELAALMRSGHPFFHAGWGRDVTGMVLEPATDWTEVTELLTESYCLLAPKKLQALVDRPEG